MTPALPAMEDTPTRKARVRISLGQPAKIPISTTPPLSLLPLSLLLLLLILILIYHRVLVLAWMASRKEKVVFRTLASLEDDLRAITVR